MATITTDDILNAIYSHVKNDEFSFQCEGCGDDSRDGSVLARKEVDSLLEQVRSQAFSEGRKAGLKEMDEAQGSINMHDQCGKYPTSLHFAQEAMTKLRQEYSAQ